MWVNVVCANTMIDNESPEDLLRRVKLQCDLTSLATQMSTAHQWWSRFMSGRMLCELTSSTFMRGQWTTTIFQVSVRSKGCISDPTTLGWLNVCCIPKPPTATALALMEQVQSSTYVQHRNQLYAELSLSSSAGSFFTVCLTVVQVIFKVPWNSWNKSFIATKEFTLVIYIA